MGGSVFKPGDHVIFTAQRRSTKPGRRARNVTPEPLGEDYTYTVNKFWVVTAVEEGDVVVMRTRRGKIRRLPADHPQLRHARWWERWLHRNRYCAWPPPAEPAAE